MRKMVKFALLGGAVGAGLGYARSTQSAGTADAAGTNDIATTAAGGAAVGLGVGFVLDRRARKKAAKKRLTLGSALTAGGVVEAARAAMPVIEHAAGVARERAAKAAEAAKPAVEAAAERTRDVAVRAAEAAKPVAAKAAERAADAAKPAVERASERGRHHADKAAGKAKDVTARVAERARTIDISDGKVREMITVLT